MKKSNAIFSLKRLYKRAISFWLILRGHLVCRSARIVRHCFLCIMTLLCLVTSCNTISDVYNRNLRITARNQRHLARLLNDYYLNKGVYPDSLITLRKYILEQWDKGVITSRNDMYGGLYDKSMNILPPNILSYTSRTELNAFIEKEYFPKTGKTWDTIVYSEMLTYIKENRDSDSKYIKRLLNRRYPLGIRNPYDSSEGYGNAFVDSFFFSTYSADGVLPSFPDCYHMILYTPVEHQQGFYLLKCRLKEQSPTKNMSLSEEFYYKGEKYGRVSLRYNEEKNTIFISNLKAVLTAGPE